MKSAALLLCLAAPLGIFSAPAQPIQPIKDPAALLQNEIARIDKLIFYTQKSLDEQKKLKELIVEYKAIQDQYLKTPQDNALLLSLVKSANRTLMAIKEYNLMQTFDPEFIEELTVLSLPASRRAAIPKT